jgi:hypothetical protein
MEGEDPMKMMAQKIMLCLAVALLSVPVICAQDLSRYRNFPLGASLVTISKQVDAPTGAIKVIHENPAVIQELTWWPIESSEPSVQRDSVQQIQFSFCDGTLYQIVATYGSSAILGLTADDMVNAISVEYGVATRPVAASSTPAGLSFSSADEQIALWENSRYSATLFRSPLSGSFQLVLLSKPLAGKAEAATAEAVRQEQADAPRMEMARQKKVADDLEAERQKNLQSFRP